MWMPLPGATVVHIWLSSDLDLDTSTFKT